MRQQYKDMFPAWVDFIDEDFDLVLSNDADSLLSCLFLNKMFGWKINYFYDFNALYQIKPSDRDRIYVDIDVVNGKGWGNHVVLINKTDKINKQMANLNTIFKVHQANYCKKYSASTFLTILSYYNYPLFLLPREAQLITLSIDAGFKGFYDKYFQQFNYFYIHNVLDMDYLFDLQKQYSKDDFYNVIGTYNLHEKIYLQNGKLATKIKLDELAKLFNFNKDVINDLFSATFTQIQEFEDVCIPLNANPNIDLSNAFSFALTNKNFAKLSLYKEGVQHER